MPSSLACLLVAMVCLMGSSLIYFKHQIKLIESSLEKSYQELWKFHEPESQGVFRFPPIDDDDDTDRNTNTSTGNTNKATMGDLKILVFMTTHMSSQHEWYLRSCWPQALQNSKLLNSSDIAVYLNPPLPRRKSSIQILQQTFKHQNLTVHLYNHTRNDAHSDAVSTTTAHTLAIYKKSKFTFFQSERFSKRQKSTLNVDSIIKQSGAMDALQQASKHSWFDNYDWIIRLNPDVIIRNDTWMLDTMLHDPEASGIFINCLHDDNDNPHSNPHSHLQQKKYKLHTDFFAVRVKDLPSDAFLVPRNQNAELSFTIDVQETILDRNKHRWVPGAAPKNSVCRAGWKRNFGMTDVTHFHPDWQNNYTCPIPFGE